jgi:NYN domain
LSKKNTRVALFVDFENLYTSLKRGLRKGSEDFGESPPIDFDALVAFVQAAYGNLDRNDFIVAANFTHYNAQIGGLSRLARLVEVDSFEPRQVRSQEQNTPGKRYVIKNYSDMVLAFQAGAHVSTNPADIYIFITGDKAFAAVASAIQGQYKKKVLFIFPNSENAAQILRERFEWISFEDTQPELEALDERPQEKENEIAPDSFAALRTIISTLRREFSSGLPADLVLAMLENKGGQKFIDRARSEEVVDLWQN